MSTSAPTVLPSENGTAAGTIHPILIAGEWRPAQCKESFRATNPITRQPLPDLYPISGWEDIDAALAAATAAARELRAMPDLDERIAAFFEAYATKIEAASDALVAAAAAETGLPASPRLLNVELPRTCGQLRQAAAAARDGSWRRPTIDTKANLRSCLASQGPVWVIGPNNFPFAFNGIAGGDFASALAAGNPVIAKAHPLHPTTSCLLAEAAHTAARAAGLPAGTIQMLYHINKADGLRLAADPRLKAIAFTGSRAAGLALKSAADAAGVLFFGELSSINPTVILPGALAENSDGIVDQLVTSLLSGTGQFCTKPGIVLLLDDPSTDAFVRKVSEKLTAAPAGVLFSETGKTSLAAAIRKLQDAGAELLAGAGARTDGAFGVPNTLLRATAQQFLNNPHAFQTEAFGNAALLVIAEALPQLLSVAETLEGNLTGAVYSARSGADDAHYEQVVALLRPRVGRLLNDKMPTGVAVSAAMNHGGPYPATNQPHFSAVGFPNSILRFTQLESYDNVREPRLPPCLRDRNPTGRMWRSIDGNWTQANL